MNTQAKPGNAKNWWQYTIDEACQALATDKHKGLTHAKAAQRLQRFGLNQLPNYRTVSPLTIFVRQFSNILTLVLIGALSIALILGDWIDVFAIGFIIILNACIGFIQEYSAERTLQALRKLTQPKSRVLRESIIYTVPAQTIVPGDIVVLEAGDRVPADGRVIHAAQLTTQEAALTGESTPIIKETNPLPVQDVVLGDRKNMAFMGTNVVGGKGHLLVTTTGQATQMGTIATLLTQAPDVITPLQVQLRQLGSWLVGTFLLIIILVFGIQLLYGGSPIQIILTALSLAVAAIPEGLPTAVTLALAIGVKKMAQRKALIRHLPAVEALGSTSVICADKTGTLTKNEMTVTTLWLYNRIITVTGIGYTPKGEFWDAFGRIESAEDPDLMLLLKISALCNNADLYQENAHWSISGDPTEGALLVAAVKAGLDRQVLVQEYPLVQEFPFDSHRKKMSVLRRERNNGIVLMVKGAVESILSKSTLLLVQGQVIPLTHEHKEQILAASHMLAQQALRTLALAYRTVQQYTPDHQSPEHDLIFVGIIAMIDPPRPEARHAIATCKHAGISVVMITGDHKETALAIARELGIIDAVHNKALSGVELDQMTDQELKKIIQNVVVYARVSVEHKVRIVTLLQQLGHIVAMTGDGVNDAPALKRANIGVAMGITGTEVTKEAADMIITDDNFASIVHAVEEGRGIYDNIVKFISYLISSNIAELLVIFWGILVGLRDPQGNLVIALLPVQLLWLNVVTDGFPAIALALDPLNPHAMERSPRKLSAPLLSRMRAVRLALIGNILAGGAFAACYSGLRTSAALGQTMAFTILVLLEGVRIHSIRAQYNLHFFSNLWLFAALALSFAMQLAVLYIPVLQKLFKTVPLGLFEWCTMGVIVAIVWIIEQAFSAFIKDYSG